MRKLAIFSTAIIFAACSSATQDKTAATAFDPSTVKPEISAVNHQFEEAFVKGDSAAIVACYHVDAQVFPPNMAPCKREGVGSMTTGVPKMGIKTIKLNTDDVSGGPDQVVETGNFEMGDGTKTMDKGSYIVVWKKDGDKWKIYRDIWNSSNMPMAAK
jgi:ketosteroid isomerase-like protein